MFVVLFAAVFYASWVYFAPKAAVPKPGPYGALAMSDDTGNYGAAWGFYDAASAEQRSMEECARTGGQNCVVKTSLNGNCSSLVMTVQGRQSFVVTDPDTRATRRLKGTRGGSIETRPINMSADGSILV